jgi:hypothetical protein
LVQKASILLKLPSYLGISFEARDRNQGPQVVPALFLSKIDYNFKDVAAVIM